jgi:hypothetical protein
MSEPFDDELGTLHDLLAARASVSDDDLEPVRASIGRLPPRRAGRRGWLAAAAGILVVVGLGGVLIVSLPGESAGPAPTAPAGGPVAPDPAAFAGDPRLAVCGVTPARATAIFELAHVRDYARQLPAAYPLVGLQADPEAPALVVVLEGPGHPERGGASADPATHDLCMVVGTEPSAWAPIAITGVDTTGLIAVLPEPSSTPIAADLVPWVNRCGGEAAGISSVIRLEHARDYHQALPLMGLSPELDVDAPAVIVVYDGRQPFALLGGAGATAEPLAPGEHDLCVLVGTDAQSAELNVYGNVPLTAAASAPPGVEPSPTVAPSPTIAPSPTDAAAGPSLPPQLDPAECEAMSFAADRCLAVVEQARTDASLGWADIVVVHLERPHPDTTSLGSHPVAEVTFELVDGSTVPAEVRCLNVGRPDDAVCTDHPEIPVYAPYEPGTGYHDVPCAGDTPAGDPTGCATPLPAIRPSAAAEAVPLEIAASDIPITSTGRLEIDVGSAVLPNGVLSDARFSLADPSTREFGVADGIRLEVRSQDPTRPPFTNAYTHGWYPGTESVEVFLVLDVTSFTPGAQLQIRDLVVR